MERDAFYCAASAQECLDFIRKDFVVKEFKVEECRSRPDTCSNLFAVTKKGILYLCSFPPCTVAILDEKVL